MDINNLYFSNHLIDRMEQRNIKKEWILFTVNNPDTTEVIGDDEIHYF
jgi:hypothetical protein